MPQDTKLLTIQEAAGEAAISVSLARKLVASGEWPSVRVGQRLLRVPALSLLAWIQGQLQNRKEVA